MLTSRLYGGCWVTSEPPRKTRPSVGSSKPPIIRSVVVLPQPDGPSMAKKLPRGIDSVRSSTAVMSREALAHTLEMDVGLGLRCCHPRSFRLTDCPPFRLT